MVIFRLARDVVERDTGQSIALRLGRRFPDALGEADAAADPATPIGLDVADDEDDDRVVGQDRAQSGEDLAQEHEVRLAVMGVVQGSVDRARIEAEEPRPEPVVVAVLDDPEVGRRRDDEPDPFRPPAGTQRRAGALGDVARVPEQGDPADRRGNLAEQAIELPGQTVEDVAVGRSRTSVRAAKSRT